MNLPPNLRVLVVAKRQSKSDPNSDRVEHVVSMQFGIYSEQGQVQGFVGSMELPVSAEDFNGLNVGQQLGVTIQ